MGRTVTRDNLSEVMEFDCPVRVHADGRVTHESNVREPELHDEQVSDGWTLLDGYSGQDRYSGPIMHPSEYIGGGMADDILSSPGVYVALVAYAEDDSEDGTDAIGWAVARRND